MGGGNIYVSSWGWDETAGRPGWRRWSISWKGERKCFIAVPEEVDIVTVWHMASALFDPETNAGLCVRAELLGIHDG